jgi:hypothetical protein
MIIQPYVDITGQATPAEVQARTLEMIEQAMNQQNLDAGQHTGLPVVAFGPKIVDLSAAPGFPPQATFTIAHDLGYSPLFLVFFYESSVNAFVPLPILDGNYFGAGPSLSFATHLYAYVDDANLYIVWQGNAQSPIQGFYYYIFGNPARAK